jgi:hypothetical protein
VAEEIGVGIMSDSRNIEIDFDVHKRIEMARESFSETPNDVLRRLLEIGGPAKPAMPPPSDGGGRSWSGKGLVLPHGTQVRMEYNGRTHSGAIVDGQWEVEGGTYGSPSAAAVGVARKKTGEKVAALDGWIYWFAKTPGSTRWANISEMRQKVA